MKKNKTGLNRITVSAVLPSCLTSHIRFAFQTNAIVMQVYKKVGLFTLPNLLMNNEKGHEKIFERQYHMESI